MEQKLTDWFPPEVKPARVDVYETNAGPNTYQYWNGKFWGLYESTPDFAFAFSYDKIMVQSPRWRGLAEPPK